MSLLHLWMTSARWCAIYVRMLLAELLVLVGVTTSHMMSMYRILNKSSIKFAEEHDRALLRGHTAPLSTVY